jgi:hypothetical protein
MTGVMGASLAETVFVPTVRVSAMANIKHNLLILSSRVVIEVTPT